MKFSAPLRRGSRWVIPIKVAKILKSAMIITNCDITDGLTTDIVSQ